MSVNLIVNKQYQPNLYAAKSASKSKKHQSKCSTKQKCDSFEYKIAHHRNKKRLKLVLSLEAIAAALTLAGITYTMRPSELTTPSIEPITIETYTQNDEIPLEEIVVAAPPEEYVEELHKDDTEIDINDEDAQAQAFLDGILSMNTDAKKDLNAFCNSLDMSELDAARHFLYMCNDEQWGNGCIEPNVVFAQICQESHWVENAEGDFNEETQKNDAAGIGQIHEDTVDQINKTYGTHYTYDDRYDAIKSLEMIVLHMRYCYNQTGYRDAALAMYNRGHKTGINEPKGQKYVASVLSHIELE